MKYKLTVNSAFDFQLQEQAGFRSRKWKIVDENLLVVPRFLIKCNSFHHLFYLIQVYLKLKKDRSSLTKKIKQNKHHLSCCFASPVSAMR